MLGDVLAGIGGVAVVIFVVLFGVGSIRRRLGETTGQSLYAATVLSVILGAWIVLAAIWAFNGGIDGLPIGLQIATGIAALATFGAIVGVIGLLVALIFMGPWDFFQNRILWPIEKWFAEQEYERSREKEIKWRAKEAGRKARREEEQKLRERGY